MQHDNDISLPAPDEASAAHSKRVVRFIREKILDAGGQISFAEYMQYVLFAPGIGYYSAGATKLGPAGDFVTAPEISPVFGKVLARQCAEVMAVLDGASILEVGAGTGRLAVDLLTKLRELDSLPAHYFILEVGADLRERQAQLIGSEAPDVLDRVQWLDDLPASHTGIVVANEVLDALPVERFAVRNRGPVQLCVSVQGNGFAMSERPSPPALQAAVEEIAADLERSLPEGYVSDLCLVARPWIASLAGAIEKGFVFLFDYGVSRREYYATDRSGGWLRCHFRHRAHNDPLVLPGIQDITAWVDFSAIAAAAVDSGLGIAGYVSQADFLLRGGLDAEFAGFDSLSVAAQHELSRQVKLLTLPGEMGENFKCMGLQRGDVVAPSAFSHADRTMNL